MREWIAFEGIKARLQSWMIAVLTWKASVWFVAFVLEFVLRFRRQDTEKKYESQAES